MAIKELAGGELLVPHFLFQSAGGSGGSPTQEDSLLLDADGEKLGVVFEAPKTGTLDGVRFRTGTVTIGDTLKVSWQDVDLTDGDPDETVDASTTIVIADGDDNVAKQTGSFTRSVTKGDLVACVFEYNSYVAGNLNIVGHRTVRPPSINNRYYLTLKTGGTWVKSAATLPKIAVEYDDGSYAYIMGADPAVGGITNESFDSGSSPDERGNIIQLPFPVRVVGLWAFIDLEGDADLVLYDSDGSTPLKTQSLDANVRASVIQGVFVSHFATAQDLLKDTNYRVTVKPTTLTNITAYSMDCVAAAVMDALVGGSKIFKTSQTDGGGFSEDNTQRYLCGLAVSGFDDGVVAALDLQLRL